MLYMTEKPRHTIQVYISSETKRVIASTCARTGMTQIEMFGRLARWFADQDMVLQQAILGQIPPQIAPDVARIALDRMANPPTAAETADIGAAAEVRAVAERMAGQVARIAAAEPQRGRRAGGAA